MCGGVRWLSCEGGDCHKACFYEALSVYPRPFAQHDVCAMRCIISQPRHPVGILAAGLTPSPAACPLTCVVDAVYVQVKEVTDTDVICVAQNSTVLEGLLTLFHVERSTGDNLSNAQVRAGGDEAGLVGRWVEGR